MNRWLGAIGVIVSAAYLAVIVWYFEVRLVALKGLELNSLGDFFAGVFGPLAIFWLILGFFQQGRELRNSQAALLLQAEELRASVREQRALAQVTKDAFDLDRKSRQLAAQPSFALKVMPHINYGDERYRATLSNFGAPAVHLYLSFRDGAMLFSAKIIGGIGHGGESIIEWGYAADAKRPLSESLTIRYFDQTQSSQAIAFEIEYARRNAADGCHVQIFSTLDL